jgi:hypothetical protein
LVASRLDWIQDLSKRSVCLAAALRVSDGWSGQGRVPHDYDERPAKAKGGQEYEEQPSDQESGLLSASGQDHAGSGTLLMGTCNSILGIPGSAGTMTGLKFVEGDGKQNWFWGYCDIFMPALYFQRPSFQD